MSRLKSILTPQLWKYGIITSPSFNIFIEKKEKYKNK